MVADCLPYGQLPLKRSFQGWPLQVIEGLEMAGLSVTLGSPWPPFALRPWIFLCAYILCNIKNVGLLLSMFSVSFIVCYFNFVSV
jgi:hypothetical protein